MANYYREFSAEIDNMTAGEAEWLLKFTSKLAAIYDAAGEDPGFNIRFSPGDDGNRSCWFYELGQGHTNVDIVAQIIQRFLRKWRPGSIWSMTWADTCSKPRLGAFGGGAVCVTADAISYMHTSTWAGQQEQAHEAPLSMGVIRECAEAGRRVSGIVPLEMWEIAIGSDIEPVLDLLSMRLTGTPLLTDIYLRPVGTTILPGGRDAILIEVSGEANLILESY